VWDNKPQGEQRKRAQLMITEKWFVEVQKFGGKDELKAWAAKVGAVNISFGGVMVYVASYERCYSVDQNITSLARMMQDWERTMSISKNATEGVAQVILNVLHRDRDYMLAMVPPPGGQLDDPRESLVARSLFEGKYSYVFDLTPKAVGSAFVVKPEEVEPRSTTALEHCSNQALSRLKVAMREKEDRRLQWRALVWIGGKEGGV
jgi:hypothetical protein